MDQFYKNSKKPMGVNSECKQCSEQYQVHYRATHRSEFSNYQKKYIKANPEIRRENVTRYRTKKNEAFVDSGITVASLKQRDGQLCGLCLGLLDEDIHIDHKVALAAGGKHEWSNVHLAHPTCNFSKGKRSMMDFTTKFWRDCT